ncbi:MAG TPA: MMPL family transporter [Frankiaceae bacterium]|nr:MMPL family transporter [Frankiaceae bacterium]
MASPSSSPVATKTGGAAERRPGGTRTAPTWLLRVLLGLGILVFLVGLVGGGYQSKLSEVQKNDNSAFLPGSAEATKVDRITTAFNTNNTIPGFLVYHRPGGLTAADRAAIADDLRALATTHGVAADQVSGPTVAGDGATATLAVPLVARVAGASVNGNDLSTAEKDVKAIGHAGTPPGLEVHTAGAGGLLGAFIDAFGGLDGKLLVTAGLVVVILLLLVYRSPVLWIVPLISVFLSLGFSSLLVYALAKSGTITLNGQSQGILSVLVFGAGTDYALLIISRYREELHVFPRRRDAMASALRGAAPPILASAATVVLSMLCLLASQLNSNRSLGPVLALGVACTLVVMLTVLPVLLVLLGRWVFWPRVPHVDEQVDLARHGLWGRVAATIGRHARPAWVISLLVLLVGILFVPGLKASGLSTTDGFTNSPDAVVGQRLYDKAFGGGGDAPAVIVTSVAGADAVTAAARAVPGIASGPAAVCPQIDYGKVSRATAAGGLPQATGPRDACPPAALTVTPRDGRTVLTAALTSPFDTDAAAATVRRLRTAVHAVPGAGALVGGQTAINLDTNDASARDRNVIIPIVLVVILVVLGLLLRALVAPLLLIASVVASFAAALGVSSIFFNHVFEFAGADPGFPLFAFIFLVALGIDYNIFLMTRVREESVAHGTREGVLRGLAVTGGVITSAGVVLAATFAVLGVLPIVFLAEIGFTVAFGVLLDTLLVRSVLVPALAYDIGRRIWWPSRLGRPSAPDAGEAQSVPL